MLLNRLPFFKAFFLKATFLRTLILKVIIKVSQISYSEFINFVSKHGMGPIENRSCVKISCVVTCNDLARIDFLKEALNSIRNQSHENIQVLIVDGIGGLQKKFARSAEKLDHRFIFREFASTSPAQARNAFLKELDGDVIIFLDDDNLFLPGYFARLADWHFLNPSIEVGVFRYVLFRDQVLVDLPISRRVSMKSLSRRNVSDTSALSFKASVVFGDFWPNVDSHEDWELLKKCISVGFRIRENNSFCMLYRVHDSNRSSPMKRQQSSK
jgi:glycosyltransferase involved in cell wall biosynthesis